VLRIAVIGGNSRIIEVLVLMSCTLYQYFLLQIIAFIMCVGNEECVIYKLLVKSLSTIQDFATKSEIVEAGRPTFDLPQLTFSKGSKTQHFHAICYDVYPWITGCARISSLFC
jgi:hypothetical protein